MLLAGTTAAQQPGISYGAGQLNETGWRQTVVAVVTTHAGRSMARDTLEREGRLSLQATPAVEGLRIRTWFDSLLLRRSSATGTLRPDTDGLIGGRYTGILSPDGRYTALRTPFLPQETLEVEDLSGVAADLLPRLPPMPLRPGARWQDSSGTLTITRLGDSAALGRSLERYRLERETAATESRITADSSRYAVSRKETETGEYVWDPERGLLRWDREIRSQAEIPAGGPFPRAVRSEIRQRIRVERIED